MPKRRTKAATGKPTLPTILLDTLRKRVAGFKRLTDRDQWQLANMLASTWKPTRQHLAGDGSLFFTHKELEHRFGRGRFIRDIAPKVDLFRVDELCPSGLPSNLPGKPGHTRRYWLTAKAKEILQAWAKAAQYGPRNKPWRLQDQDGLFVSTAPKAIAAKAKDGNSRKGYRNLPCNLTPVNLLALRHYLRDILIDLDPTHYRNRRDLFDPENDPYDSFARTKLMRLRDQIAQVIILACTDIGGQQFVPHRYIQHRTGRLYAEGKGNLQNVPRKIRKIALQGQFDYDLENCHYTIFYQLAARLGIEAPAVADYLRDKKGLRDELTGHIGRQPAETDEIKSALIALIYGADPRSKYWRAAIPDTLGAQGAELFRQHPKVRRLHAELQRIGPELIAAHTTRYGIQNAMGCSRKPADKRTRHDDKGDLAHILQGYEAKMMELALDRYGDKITLLQHDGFTTSEKIDSKLLVQDIRDTLNLDMEFDRDRLQPDADKIDPASRRRWEQAQENRKIERDGVHNQNTDAVF